MIDGGDDTQQLLDSVIPVAEDLIISLGEFYPFAGAMKPDGEIVSISAIENNVVDEQHPDSDVLQQKLSEQLRSAANKKMYKATAVAVDVALQLPDSTLTDAIAVYLDHESGYSVVVYMPYKLVNGKVEYGEISVQAGSQDVFSTS
ncbi:hypothetical protein C2869_15365 [Saccharobesus litoralis]|uniref:Uncharacterized protein n=1 Tax=Saccharobesus litoralis TaxID=2172099 RepID=A0A2S0VU87_9ALTE|nr:hypothetical protein [Saccharobesus litoralis]AWB67732.1 hypothetical protein C2869_15365 [Saccharobesus litoralis]